MPLGYIAACVAGGTMTAVALFGYDPDPEFVAWFVASIVLMTFWSGAIAFLPALLAIVLAEAFGWRSVVYYLLVGGAIGLLADRLSDYYGSLDFADRRTVILLAAGFVGGFAYWLTAGRLAGSPPEAIPGIASEQEDGAVQRFHEKGERL